MHADDIIRTLQLEPHPEGGFFRETYRSAETLPAPALPARYAGPRAVGTSIYFLLTGDTFSSFHRLRSDEIWHYHLGDAVQVTMLHADGRRTDAVVGSNLAAGEQLQLVIPAGTWFGARVTRSDGFVLVGCTVSPGFDFADFELARRDDVLAAFPHHHDIIHQLTRTP